MSTDIRARDLVISRVIDAPVEQVWRAWTDPDMIRSWWGPEGFTSHKAEMDVREGGRYILNMMRASEEEGGGDFYDAGVYNVVLPNQRLEMTDYFSDAEGNPIDPTQVGMPADFPREVEIIVEFEDLGSRTRLTVTQRGMPEGQERDLSQQGMNESLDKLVRVIGAC